MPLESICERIMVALRKFVCKSCKREIICIAGNVTLMDVYNDLYIVRQRRYRLSPIGASRDRGFLAHSDRVDRKWHLLDTVQ